MAARSAWAGAIEFGGFPIHLKAYTLVKSKAADSLTNLCPCHNEPVKAPRACAVTGDILNEELVKGVKVGKAVYALDDAAVEALAKDARTDVLTIHSLPPRVSVPLHLAIGHYRLVPNDDVPGSAGPANILWNGLRVNDRVLIAEWVKRAGSRNEQVAITADTYGLTGITLPYATDLNTVPEFAFTEDDAQAQMFEAFATQQGVVMDNYSHGAIEDTYGKRRAEVLAKVVAGEALPVSTTAAPKPAVPDLMAAMQAAMSAAPTTASTKPKRATKAKVKA